MYNFKSKITNLKPLSISIVLYKTPSLQLKKCISSLQKIRELADLYIIDNSPNTLLKKYKKLFQGATYVSLKSNEGYSRGHNKALEIASIKKYEYHLVLNADCYFESNVITKLIDIMDKNKNIGLIMPKVLNPNGSLQQLCKLIPKPTDLFISLFLKVLKLDSTFKPTHIISKNLLNKPCFVPYLSGCFMFLRWSTLKDVGFFDKKFFMYAEDIDLSRRIAEKYLTIYFPYIYIYHEHGMGSYKSFRLFFIHAKNLIFYFNKWGWFFDKKRALINQKAIDFTPGITDSI